MNCRVPEYNSSGSKSYNKIILFFYFALIFLAVSPFLITFLLYRSIKQDYSDSVNEHKALKNIETVELKIEDYLKEKYPGETFYLKFSKISTLKGYCLFSTGGDSCFIYKTIHNKFSYYYYVYNSNYTEFQIRYDEAYFLHSQRIVEIK